MFVKSNGIDTSNTELEKNGEEMQALVFFLCPPLIYQYQLTKYHLPRVSRKPDFETSRESVKLFVMKKTFLILFSVLFFGSANAQKTGPIVNKEEVRLVLAKGMTNFVTGVKPFYVKGQDQQKFVTQVCGTWKPTPEGNALLVKAYEFIVKAASPENIVSSYNGKEMAASVLYLKKVFDLNPNSNGSELFGGKTGVSEKGVTTLAREGGCRWYQLWCHLENFANWIVKNWDVIKNILITLITIL